MVQGAVLGNSDPAGPGVPTLPSGDGRQWLGTRLEGLCAGVRVLLAHRLQVEVLVTGGAADLDRYAVILGLDGVDRPTRSSTAASKLVVCAMWQLLSVKVWRDDLGLRVCLVQGRLVGLPRWALRRCNASQLLGCATAIQAHHLLAILVHGGGCCSAPWRRPVQAVSAEAKLAGPALVYLIDLWVSEVDALEALERVGSRRLTQDHQMRLLLALPGLHLLQLVELFLRETTAVHIVERSMHWFQASLAASPDPRWSSCKGRPIDQGVVKGAPQENLVEISIPGHSKRSIF